jgi:hypothetical protein
VEQSEDYIYSSVRDYAGQKGMLEIELLWIKIIRSQTLIIWKGFFYNLYFLDNRILMCSYKLRTDWDNYLINHSLALRF